MGAASEEYYFNTSRKYLDFILGFFGIGIGSYILLGFLSMIKSEYLFPIGVLFLAILMIVLGFKKGRRYISIGIIFAASLLALLLVVVAFIMENLRT